MSQDAAHLAQADQLSAAFPPLLAAAQRLASVHILGAHGRRAAGLGDSFWQYRTALPSDSARSIDWRRSGRGDALYVREREWQAAQNVHLWIDEHVSMAFTSQPRHIPEKAARAALLALALGLLFLRGGERVGLAPHPARAGKAHSTQLAAQLQNSLTEVLNAAHSGASSAKTVRSSPDQAAARPIAHLVDGRGYAVLFSDFLGDLAPIEATLRASAAQGGRGALVQILDPVEQNFPYKGRMIFEDLGAHGPHYDTHEAQDVQSGYLERLGARQKYVADLARRSGWQMHVHCTNTPAQSALLWLCEAAQMSGGLR